MRADARRNRERIVAAATDLFAEQGVSVSLDAIAKRAEVGTGTLYRHFSDRPAMAQAVALHAFTTVNALARDAMLHERGLAWFLSEVSRVRIGVLMATLLPILSQLPEDTEIGAAFDAMMESVEKLVGNARRSGELRADATADDVMLLLAMLTRPLQGVPSAYTAAMTPRLLHLVVEGLAPSPRTTAPPPGAPRPTRDEVAGELERLG